MTWRAVPIESWRKPAVAVTISTRTGGTSAGAVGVRPDEQATAIASRPVTAARFIVCLRVCLGGYARENICASPLSAVRHAARRASTIAPSASLLFVATTDTLLPGFDTR